jgi:hypothetical protein
MAYIILTWNLISKLPLREKGGGDRVVWICLIYTEWSNYYLIPVAASGA